MGSNIEGALNPARREAVSGSWDSLPKTVTDIGRTPEELFAAYATVKEKIGAAEMANIPYGAVAICTLADKLGAGLQQLLAGARKFAVTAIDRRDIASANRETERETGVPFVQDMQDEVARGILLG